MGDTIVGIDPGMTGGMAVIFPNGRVEWSVMPVAGGEIDAYLVHNWLYQAVRESELDGDTVSVFLEKVHSMPKQSMPSMFKFGVVYGVIRGVVGAMGLPLYLVAPQTWKKKILANTAKDKAAAIDFCRRVYPKVDLRATERSKKPHNGLADALCIAHYGYERLRKDAV